MSRYIDADALIQAVFDLPNTENGYSGVYDKACILNVIEEAPTIDIVICEECRKSHVDGKTTHYLWCNEWGRSTDPFGYCERGERESE